MTETTLPNWLLRSAENFPHHLALQCDELRWSFAELDRQATRLARQLATVGVQEGSRVTLLAANGPAYVACVHALTLLGAILVPLNTRLTLTELCWQVHDVRATLLINDIHFLARATEIVETIPTLPQITLSTENGSVFAQRLYEKEISLRTETALGATQAIMYTSGTTGNPKGVIITYGMQWWNAVGSALNLGHNADDCWLACLPFFHVGGLTILMKSVIYGISVIALEKFTPTSVNRAIRESGVTIISVVAVMLQRMLDALDQERGEVRYPPTLRCVLLGGGPAPRPLLEDCARRGVPVAQTYGLTEACSQAVTLAPADALRKIGSAGRPLMPVQLRIMGEDGPAAQGEPGVILLKGPSITPGYADRPAQSCQVLHDGWLTTGDIGYLDEEGYLYVLDRRSDMIISGGENVYPAEIEAVLLSHPAVTEAGVCGQADEQWGQVPLAFVHLREGHAVNPDELLAYAAERLAHYKLPRAIYVVGALPRNSSGKLLRRELPRLLAHLDLPPA